jgi:hypothetical protein
MGCLVKIADISQPVRRGVSQFLPQESQDASWQEWYQNLLLCCERLSENTKKELPFMNAEQLESATAELEGIAYDAVGVARTLRVAVFELQEAYESHRRELEESLGLPGGSEGLSAAHEDEDSGHDEYVADDPAARQLRDWIDELDELDDPDDSDEPDAC